MKKIYVLLIVLGGLFFFSSCSQLVRNSYTIQGDDSLYVGTVASYNVQPKFGSTEPSNITWKISDESIATLNNRGELTSLAEGVVTIFASFIDRDDTVSLKKDINITILGQSDKGDEDVTFLIVGPEKLYKGQQTQLYITSLNSAKVDAVKWIDDGQGLVTVTDSATGDIEVHSDSGEVVINATVSSGGKEYEVSKTFPLYNGTLVLEYDISQSSEVNLPLSITTPNVSSASTSIYFPIFHDLVIDWGDGEKTVVNIEESSYLPSIFDHTYSEDFSSSNGTVLISISGDIVQLIISGSQRYNDGEAPWIDVKQWGNAAFIGITSGQADPTYLSGPFYLYSGEAFSATDTPYLEGDLPYFFSKGNEDSLFNPNVGHWDMSNVTSMVGMFSSLKGFDRDLNGWDVSNVMYMDTMFLDAESFNSDLDQWDVSSVVSMREMFVNTTSFDGSLAGWDVSSVMSMDNMFLYYSQDGVPQFTGKGLDTWNPSPYTTFTSMFQGVLSLSGDLSSWEMKRISDGYGSDRIGGWTSMFSGTNFDIAYHPLGCTSDCGISHP